MNDNFGILLRNPHWETALALNKLRIRAQLQQEDNAADCDQRSPDDEENNRARDRREDMDCNLGDCARAAVRAMREI